MENDYSLLDKHFSSFLADLDNLSGSDREEFRDIVMRLTAGLERGSSCILLSAGELRSIEHRSCLTVAVNLDTLPQTPLVLYGRRLYLQRYFYYESRLARQLKNLSEAVLHGPGAADDLLDLCFGNREEDGELNCQRLAGEKSLIQPFLMISGGPGTGKTTTVVRIIATLHHFLEGELSVALCAPTGKAAQRLYESVTKGIPLLPEALRRKAGAWLPDSAMTLHRLLGYQQNSTQFVKNSQKPLSYDLVLVDEASMVDLALMGKLVDALKPGSRLILLGDKDQLASVESGTVLSAALAGLPDCSVELKKTYRFTGMIKDVAEAVKRGDENTFLELVRQHDLLLEDWQQRIENNFATYISLAAKTECRDVALLFQQLKEFMVLCCLRRGVRGVEGINRMVETHLYLQGYAEVRNPWYQGRPVLVSRNDYNLGLYNGDIGICLKDEQGILRVWFEDGNSFKMFPTAVLHNCETLYAMTIHKSQGSEFDAVLLVFPETDNSLLCRELLYTGITRAKRELSTASQAEIMGAAVSRVSQRGTGLTEMLRES